MKEAFVLLFLLFSVVFFAVITPDPFTHRGVQITFPGEIRYLTYGNQAAVVLDISFHTDTMFLPVTLSFEKSRSQFSSLTKEMT